MLQSSMAPPTALHEFFKSITLEIKDNDSLEIVSSVKAQAEDFKLISRETWKIENSFSCKVGDNWKESKIEIYKQKMIFNPDPFFNPKEIKFTEFERIE